MKAGDGAVGVGCEEEKWFWGGCERRRGALVSVGCVAEGEGNGVGQLWRGRLALVFKG